MVGNYAMRSFRKVLQDIDMTVFEDSTLLMFVVAHAIARVSVVEDDACYTHDSGLPCQATWVDVRRSGLCVLVDDPVDSHCIYMRKLVQVSYSAIEVLQRKLPDNFPSPVIAALQYALTQDGRDSGAHKMAGVAALQCAI